MHTLWLIILLLGYGGSLIGVIAEMASSEPSERGLLFFVGGLILNSVLLGCAIAGNGL